MPRLIPDFAITETPKINGATPNEIISAKESISTPKSLCFLSFFAKAPSILSKITEMNMNKIAVWKYPLNDKSILMMPEKALAKVK